MFILICFTGEDDQTQQWIFAFTAGMFIYISCADLVSVHLH